MDKEEVIIDEPQQDLVAYSESEVDNILVIAEKRLQSIKRIKEFALSLTNESNWLEMGGKPYLDAAGCEKVARPFGVKIKFADPNNPYRKITGSDELGEYYIYIFFGKALMEGGRDEIDVIGKCSSRDKFFAQVDGQLKPISEVDEPNIMMKAYNNMFMNGVKRLLGLRNMTWEEVKRGTTKEKSAKIDYHSRKAETDPDIENKKKEIIAKIEKLLNENADVARHQEILEKLTKYKDLPKAKSTNDLKKFTLARCTVLYGKLKREFDIKNGNGKPKEEKSKENETGELPL